MIKSRRRPRRTDNFLLWLAVAATACGRAGAPVQSTAVDFPDRSAGSAAWVVLAPGQSVTIGEVHPLRVTFDSVTSDSRCPPDVQCVWQGEATVRLSLAWGDSSTVTSLNTVRDPRRVEYGGHTIALRAVTPAPRTGGIEPEEYRATISVERR